MSTFANKGPLQKPLVIVVLGPTASGKTDLAIEIALQLNLTIQNIDSRQLYKGMNIGTAKPSIKQQQSIRHHLLDLREPNRQITLQEFQFQAMKSIDQALHSRGIALLAGGSGLYIKAIISGFCPPSVSPQTELRAQLKSLGQKTCYSLLRSADPLSAQLSGEADAIRTQRALEVLYATGRPISIQKQNNPPKWKVLELGLNPQNLKDRIAERTIQLYQNGLIEETNSLIKAFDKDLPLLQTIGYGEALKVISGMLKIEEAIGITIKRTQNFAKRQLTWFRKQHDPTWLNNEDPVRQALKLIQSALV